MEQAPDLESPDSAPSTFLEGNFPFAEVSALARRDRYTRDHVYAQHKWWARRPPAVIRALLLAATLPHNTSAGDFWTLFATSETALDGLHVGDPFMGGATTLVEARRLGADVSGVDVDPLAVRIAEAELGAFDLGEYQELASSLLAHLSEELDCLYPSSPSRIPLHYFWLRRASCPSCAEPSLVFRDLWLARDQGKRGAVVRDQPGVAFCPDCQEIHVLDPGRKELRCCGRRHRLDAGTYARARFTCPCCGSKASNDQLQVGTLDRVLVGIEETVEGERRHIRAPSQADHRALEEATKLVRSGALPIPSTALDGVDSGRPASYGFESVSDLFSNRQQAVLATAFKWTRAADGDAGAKRALLLALSNAVGSNNLLCGYATDYGRLSAIFSGVRAYSMPVLSVELNPLHPAAGRGTLSTTIARVARSRNATVTRATYEPNAAAVKAHTFASHGSGRHSVKCRSADRPLPKPFGEFDLVVTDPPYYDFIPYSDLSLLYRAWHSDDAGLGGAPIFPVGPDREQQFARRLGRAFGNVRKALKPEGVMTFTFHSSHAEAWRALEAALTRAKFWVTTAFPAWADGRAAGHGNLGNCEWDLVFVCRPTPPPAPGITVSSNDWLAALSPEEIQPSDRASMELGLDMARRLSRRGAQG